MADVDQVEMKVIGRLDAVFKLLRSNMKAALKEIHTTGGLVDKSAFNVARLDSIIRGIRGAIDGAGYQDAIETQLEGLADLHDKVKEEAEDLGLGSEFSTESKDAIRVLISGAEQELVAVRIKVADELSSVLRRAIFGGGEITDIVDTIETKLDITNQQAATLARSTIHAFYSMLSVDHAKENGVEWYAYLGPDDENTRPFCNFWVGRRGTLEMFQATADDEKYGRGNQPADVVAWRGGYNCRHRLVPLVGKDIKDYPEGPREGEMDD